VGTAGIDVGTNALMSTEHRNTTPHARLGITVSPGTRNLNPASSLYVKGLTRADCSDLMLMKRLQTSEAQVRV